MGKGERVLNYIVALGLVVLGLGVAWATGIAVSMPRATWWLIFACFVVGFMLGAVAKVSVIRKGQLFTIGLSLMSRQTRIAY